MGVATHSRRRPKRFYHDALNEAERRSLAEAEKVEGFEQEIAMLRLRLKTLIDERPEDVQLMLRGMEVLRRLVVSRYGLSRQDEQEMTPYIEETMRRIRERGEGRRDA